MKRLLSGLAITFLMISPALGQNDDLEVDSLTVQPIEGTSFMLIDWSPPTPEGQPALSNPVFDETDVCRSRAYDLEGQLYEVRFDFDDPLDRIPTSIVVEARPSLYGADAVLDEGSFTINIGAYSVGVIFDVCVYFGDDTGVTLEVAAVNSDGIATSYSSLLINNEQERISGSRPPGHALLQTARLDARTGERAEGPGAVEEYLVSRFDEEDVADSSWSVPGFETQAIDYDTQPNTAYIYRVTAVYQDGTQARSPGILDASSFDGNPLFSREDLQTDVQAVGAIWGDFDADGLDDLFVPRSQENTNVLFINVGGTLQPANWSGGELLENTQGAVWGDYDNDGDLDLLVANSRLAAENTTSRLYRNEGGSLEPVSTGTVETLPRDSRSASWVDFDNDGDLDLFFANRAEANSLFRNEGGDIFRPLTSLDVGEWLNEVERSVGSFWADYDNDGDSDLLVVSNLGTEPNSLYINQLSETGEARFVPATEAEAGPVATDAGRSISASWGDYDSDGDLDLFVANEFASVDDVNGFNWLYENTGCPDEGDTCAYSFAHAGGVVEEETGKSNSSAWSDFDGDGDLDLYTNTTTPETGDKRIPVIYTNDGGGSFSKTDGGNTTTFAAGLFGAAWADANGDGAPDLFLPDAIESESPVFLNNPAAGKAAQNRISVRLQGTASNRSGVGARARLWTVRDGEPVGITREVASLSGTGGQNSLTMHFGLGDATSIDSVTVDWPSSGRQFVAGDPFTPGGVFTIIEQEASVIPIAAPGELPDDFVLEPAYPNPFNPVTTIRYAVPHMTRGRIVVFDALGRELEVLRDGVLTPGRHEVRWDAGGMASGLYLVRLEVEGRAETRTLVLAK